MTTQNSSNTEKYFTNGTIYLDAKRKVKNIVVKNRKVIAVDVKKEDYKDAAIVDLNGGFAYPGFCDSHVHPLEVGVMSGGAILFNCATAAEIAEKMAETIKKMPKDTPKDSPMLGVGFYPKDYEAWSLEDLAIIDEVTGSRPILLVDKLGHNCIINSVTINLCKLTSKTPMPMGGSIVLQDDKPTGMLRESAMLIAGNLLFPLINDDEIIKGAENIFNHWSEVGYTGVVDLMGGPFGRMLRPELCRKMEEQNALPLRMNYMYTFTSLDEIDNALKLKEDDTELVRFCGLKIFVDGAYSAGQAWTKDENLLGHNGLYFVYSDDSYGEKYNLNRIVEKINEIGFNTHYHVQGDQAICTVLDALDNAIAKQGKLTSVHTLVHIAFPTDEQIERIKNFNGHVVATVQPSFWEAESGNEKYYGDKDFKAYPIKKLIDAGISTGMSTDFSVSPIELAAPSSIMGIAMNGAGDPENHPPLTMESLIEGFTVGSAATTPYSHENGKLDIGYNADMVIYNKDLYSVTKEELSKDNPKVMSTWLGGCNVYKS
jgi:predicted amidohydrolase YtcJ